MTGPTQDSVWSSIANGGAKILNAMGAGAQQGWGSEPLGLPADAEKALRDAELMTGYRDDHYNFVKAFNDVTIRPAAAAVDAAQRIGAAALTGVGGGLAQVSSEISPHPGSTHSSTIQDIAAGIPGGLSEIAYGATEGFLPELPGHVPELAERASFGRTAASEAAVETSHARAAGVTGEGEAGFYDAEPLTPQNVQARTAAAADAGMDQPPVTQPPPVDLHELARRVDPDTFEKYDALALERDAASNEYTRLAGESLEERPGVAEARRELNELIGLDPNEPAMAGHFDERLRAIAASAPDDLLEKVADAYGRLDDALTQPTEAMLEAQRRMQAADLGMRDLAPQVSQAYRDAADMTPEPLPLEAKRAEGAEGKEGTAAKGREEAAGAAQEGEERPQGTTPALIPEVVQGEGAAAFQGPNVLGDETLGEARGDASGQTEQVEAREVEREGQASQAAETTGATTEGPVKTRVVSGPLKAVEGTGELKARSLSEGVEAKAVEEGLTSAFGDLPEYRQISMAEQAEGAAKLVNSDLERAKAIAMGERQAPKGLLPESVFVAVERHALATGDIDTLRALGTRSKLSSAATTMGQRIRTLGERDKTSPVGAIAEIQAAREADLKARNLDLEAEKAKVSAEIKAEIKRAPATKKVDAWANFLGSIRCDI